MLLIFSHFFLWSIFSKNLSFNLILAMSLRGWASSNYSNFQLYHAYHVQIISLAFRCFFCISKTILMLSITTFMILLFVLEHLISFMPFNGVNFCIDLARGRTFGNLNLWTTAYLIVELRKEIFSAREACLNSSWWNSMKKLRYSYFLDWT